MAPYNRMSKHCVIKGRRFKKSQFSPMVKSQFACVGVSIEKDAVYIINTTTKGPILKFSHDEWAAFLAGVKAGEFDT